MELNKLIVKKSSKIHQKCPLQILNTYKMSLLNRNFIHQGNGMTKSTLSGKICLSNKQVVNIREKYAKRELTKEVLSYMHKVSVRYIHETIIGTRHKDVGGPITKLNSRKWNYIKFEDVPEEIHEKIKQLLQDKRHNKYNEKTITMIQNLYATKKYTQQCLGKLFGFSQVCVWNMLNGDPIKTIKKRSRHDYVKFEDVPEEIYEKIKQLLQDKHDNKIINMIQNLHATKKYSQRCLGKLFKFPASRIYTIIHADIKRVKRT